MIKIRYLSDLHLEFGSGVSHPKRGKEDVVVLAGDISVGTKGIHWAQRVFAPTPVIYVLGNHEYYGENFDGLIVKAKEKARDSNVHVLENDAVVVQGYRFLGCTLWSDFDILGPERRAEGMEAAQQLLNDYLRIRQGPNGKTRTVLPEETRARHLVSRQWLHDSIAASAEPVIVVTHHGPIIEASAPQYRGSLLSGAFTSDLRSLIKPPVRLWFYGHTHHNEDGVWNQVRVLANQRGYAQDDFMGFGWDNTIELATPHPKNRSPC
ncbi:MAG: metallophosphoesterase [Stagnimonas sp.]|nr:metallophosphoesterase [Stagnimonas sp.]